ncbi:hypothetical protein ACVXG7_10090 [Enterobacter hormaechei]
MFWPRVGRPSIQRNTFCIWRCGVGISSPVPPVARHSSTISAATDSPLRRSLG